MPQRKYFGISVCGGFKEAGMSAKGGLMMGTLSSLPKRIISIIAYFDFDYLFVI